MKGLEVIFFEAVRRFKMKNNQWILMKLRYFSHIETVYNRESEDPYKIVSPEANLLLGLDFDTEYERIQTMNPPHMSAIVRVPWLSNELFSVAEPNYHHIQAAVEREGRDLFNQLFRSNGEVAGDAEAAPQETEP